METYQHIANLLLKQLKGELTVVEETELNRWVNASATNKALFEELTRQESLNEEVVSFYSSKERIWSTIQLSLPGSKLVQLYNPWKRWAVAASIILVLGLGSYFAFFHKNRKQEERVKVIPADDVEAPKITKAMITLADGRNVSIDSLTALTQGNVAITKTADGKIIYSGASSEMLYNTLSNPRGSKVIDMTLADGSRVWLNAGSSVRYPVAFVGKERKVSITGEAYFEVTHDATKPFYVSKDDMSIQVLGTHFNVNAYDDEKDIKVTLLEGSVKVSNNAANSLLKPGQQASVTNDVKVINNVDLEQVMAWKNGRFQFEGSGIEEVMRQITRWYDVEVVYEVKPQEVHFRGGISRNVEASKVFKMLETTDAVHFRIEGKKVFVIK